jgi:hypothetical protein
VLIAEEGTDLASDLVGQRTIFFDSSDLDTPEKTNPRITKALTEAIANPAAGSPVQAAARLGALAAGDAEQKAVADLVNEVALLRRDLDKATRSMQAGQLPPSRIAAIAEQRAAEVEQLTAEVTELHRQEIERRVLGILGPMIGVEFDPDTSTATVLTPEPLTRQRRDAVEDELDLMSAGVDVEFRTFD